MHASRFLPASLFFGLLVSASSAALAQNSATYQVRFDATWSATTHPGAYPQFAHFSPLIGGTHSSAVHFWQAGGNASTAIESMAETGSPTALKNIVLSAIGSGTAGQLLQGSSINSPGATTLNLTVTEDHPLVTLVTMLAPSPDWFVGTEALDLRPNGVWLHSLTVPLLTWDAGTDSGVDFSSSNFDTNPQVPISLITAGPFTGTDPVGTFTFTRVVTSLELCNGDGGDQLGCTACPCSNEAPLGTIGGCLNSAGSSAQLSCIGTPSIAVDTLRFELDGAPPSAFCLLSSGDTLAPNNVANPCFGLGSGLTSPALDGLRCAVLNTQRHGGRSADASGTVGSTTPGWGPPDNPQAGISGQAGFVSGQTRYFQAIYREDPLSGCMRGLNTSQALGATFVP